MKSEAFKAGILLVFLARALAITDEQTETISDASSKLSGAVDSIASMDDNTYTRKLLPSIGLQEKLDKARGHVAKIQTKILGDTDAEDKAERISGALAGVGDGIVGIVEGYNAGDWTQIVQGGIGIVSSLIALAGPLGMLASSILSMISSFFSLFSGSQSESQESMVKRVVEAAINDFRHKDLKEDIEGTKYVYQSLSNSIQNYRERMQLTTSQAEHLYGQAFSELAIFGKLKARIKEVCLKPKDITEAETCLDFVQLYAELSILRQLILADLASLLSEETIGLESTANNVLNIIKNELISDKEIFSYFADPLHHPGKRIAAVLFFSNPDKYAVVNSYLQALNDKVDKSLFEKDVLVCLDEMLKGTCSTLDVADHADLEKLNLHNKIKSLFIPKGKQIYAWPQKNFAGTPYGPFVGPVAHGLAAGQGKWLSVKVSKTTDNIENHVRFCEKPNMDPSGLCDSFNPTEKEIGRNIYLGSTTSNPGGSFHGTNWENKIQSIYVPRRKKVLGYIDKIGNVFGPYLGPQVVNNVCTFWDKRKWLLIRVTNARYQEDARKLTEFCSKPNLDGVCVKDGEDRTTLAQVNGKCNLEKKIQSIKIPGGFSVMGYSGKDFTKQRFGPYTGPITIDTVDGKGEWMSYKIEEQLTEEAKAKAKLKSKAKAKGKAKARAKAKLKAAKKDVTIRKMSQENIMKEEDDRE